MPVNTIKLSDLYRLPRNWPCCLEDEVRIIQEDGKSRNHWIEVCYEGCHYEEEQPQWIIDLNRGDYRTPLEKLQKRWTDEWDHFLVQNRDWMEVSDLVGVPHRPWTIYDLRTTVHAAVRPMRTLERLLRHEY